MTFHARIACTLSVIAVFTPAFSFGAAHASNILFISTTGKNSNACTLAAPCRTLQRAISLTPSGGEIRILDSGFFGKTATIRKPLTISGNGQTVHLGSPIVIDEADAVVTLRGLTLNGRGADHSGINVNAAAVVRIERCVVRGFASNGIQSVAGGAEMLVTDSISRDNTDNGIFVDQAAGLTVDNSRFENNGAAGVIVRNTNTAISRSIAAGNGGQGIAAVPASISIRATLAVQNGNEGFVATSGSVMTVDASLAHGNGNGLRVINGARALISNSTFTGNRIGIDNGSGFRFIETLQNNTVRGNLTDIAGGPPVPVGGL